jgi:5'-deoxynucleotidase YfbR-like HD superfamily hydrolase
MKIQTVTRNLSTQTNQIKLFFGNVRDLIQETMKKSVLITKAIEKRMYDRQVAHLGVEELKETFEYYKEQSDKFGHIMTEANHLYDVVVEQVMQRTDFLME